MRGDGQGFGAGVSASQLVPNNATAYGKPEYSELAKIQRAQT